jgi:glycosyltransferase involved in cell wall biosynthesis
MPAIKVVHISTVHPRYDVRIFRKECESLAARGYDVHLIVADGGGGECKNSVHLHDIGRVDNRFMRMLLQPLRALFLARGLAGDIYHLHDPELLLIALFLRVQGAHVIYDAHEDVPRAIQSKNWIKPSLRQIVALNFEGFENFVVKRISGVIGATPHITRRFSKINNKSVNINNFPLISELKIRNNQKRLSNTICYIGLITEIRGAVEMVESLDYLDARLVLAGPMTEALKARLEALRSWSKVDYRGVVDRDDAQKILGESSIGLVLFHPEPNHIFSQPNKIFEYMNAGLPVIVSDFPDWRSLIDSTRAGICVDPKDPKVIAMSIESLLGDRALAVQMGENGRIAVSQRYRWDLEEVKLFSFYNEILNRAGNMELNA